MTRCIIIVIIIVQSSSSDPSSISWSSNNSRGKKRRRNRNGIETERRKRRRKNEGGRETPLLSQRHISLVFSSTNSLTQPFSCISYPPLSSSSPPLPRSSENRQKGKQNYPSWFFPDVCLALLSQARCVSMFILFLIHPFSLLYFIFLPVLTMYFFLL